MLNPVYEALGGLPYGVYGIDDRNLVLYIAVEHISATDLIELLTDVYLRLEAKGYQIENR
jgi:uncharacterized protein (UPF0297 family)